MNRYYNTTDSGVTIDDEGRQVGGREWVEAEENDQIRHALELGLLIDQGQPEDNGQKQEPGNEGSGEGENAEEQKSSEVVASDPGATPGSAKPRRKTKNAAESDAGTNESKEG